MSCRAMAPLSAPLEMCRHANAMYTTISSEQAHCATLMEQAILSGAVQENCCAARCLGGVNVFESDMGPAYWLSHC